MTPLVVLLVGLLLIALVILYEFAQGMSSMGGGGDRRGTAVVFFMGLGLFLLGLVSLVWQWLT